MAKHQLSPSVRGAFLRALESLEKKDSKRAKTSRYAGYTLSDMFVEALEEHGFLRVLELVSRYKEQTAELTVSQVSLVGVLEDMNRHLADTQEAARLIGTGAVGDDMDAHTVLDIHTVDQAKLEH